MARILVVDDEEGVREFIARALEMHGHTVRVAKDGVDAVVALEEQRFDLLLSDVRMPLMDGVSLALKVRSELPALKILLMTGFAGELERAYNMHQLIDGVLAKPFSINVLLDKVRFILQGDMWPQHVRTPKAAARAGFEHKRDRTSGVRSLDAPKRPVETAQSGDPSQDSAASKGMPSAHAATTVSGTSRTIFSSRPVYLSSDSYGSKPDYSAKAAYERERTYAPGSEFKSQLGRSSKAIRSSKD